MKSCRLSGSSPAPVPMRRRNPPSSMTATPLAMAIERISAGSVARGTGWAVRSVTGFVGKSW
jgi:hypothetical protein